MESKRSVFKSGNALVVSLTKAFKELGIEAKDKVFVETDNGGIHISKNPINRDKPDWVSEEIWKGFESVLVKLYGKDTIKNKEEVKKYLEEAIKNWIKEKDKWYNKKILKV